MMKRCLILAALLPFACLAQPINTLNNPNQPGYQIPSQQRMQTQMQTQQIQQKGMLNQQLKSQTQLQQQNLQTQMNNNQQRRNVEWQYTTGERPAAHATAASEWRYA